MNLKNLPANSIKELSINSGTAIVILLWLSSRYAVDNPALSLAFLGLYAALDQINSRFWLKWMEIKFDGDVAPK
jgi:hypothetical protein